MGFSIGLTGPLQNKDSNKLEGLAKPVHAGCSPLSLQRAVDGE